MSSTGFFYVTKEAFMKKSRLMLLALTFCLLSLAITMSSSATHVFAGNTSHDPTWWDKYQFILKNGADPAPGSTASLSVGNNVDVSNECGPQSETFITINTNNPDILAAGSNEIFRQI